jgi:hypothetical protein
MFIIGIACQFAIEILQKDLGKRMWQLLIQSLARPPRPTPGMYRTHNVGMLNCGALHCSVQTEFTLCINLQKAE